jgi:hypothetical protein
MTPSRLLCTAATDVSKDTAFYLFSNVLQNFGKYKSLRLYFPEDCNNYEDLSDDLKCRTNVICFCTKSATG